MSDVSWFGDTLLRKGVTVSLILMLAVVSCWTYSRVSALDDSVVFIEYPEHFVDVVVPSVLDDVVESGVDTVDDESDDIAFPILHGLVERRISRLERFIDLFR